MATSPTKQEYLKIPIPNKWWVKFKKSWISIFRTKTGKYTNHSKCSIFQLPSTGVRSANWFPHHAELCKSTLVGWWIQFGCQVNERFIQSCPIHHVHFIMSNFLSGSPMYRFACCVFKASHIDWFHSVPKYNHSHLIIRLSMYCFVYKNVFVHDYKLAFTASN